MSFGRQMAWNSTIFLFQNQTADCNDNGNTWFFFFSVLAQGPPKKKTKTRYRVPLAGKSEALLQPNPGFAAINTITRIAEEVRIRMPARKIFRRSLPMASPAQPLSRRVTWANS